MDNKTNLTIAYDFRKKMSGDLQKKFDVSCKYCGILTGWCWIHMNMDAYECGSQY